MAVRNTLVEVADGDQLNEGYFNGNFQRVKKFIFSSATEESTVSASATNVIKTGELIPDTTTDSVVLGGTFSFELKQTGGASANARVAIEGITVTDIQQDLDGTYTTYSGVLSLTPQSGIGSYTIDLRLWGDGGATAFVQNVVITVFVLQGTMDSASPAFS